MCYCYLQKKLFHLKKENLFREDAKLEKDKDYDVSLDIDNTLSDSPASTRKWIFLIHRV